MNRAQRLAAKAGSTFQACKPDDLARAAVAADQAGQPGHAHLLREIRSGGLAVVFISDRNDAVTAAELSAAARPTVVVIGDDDYASGGPGAWRSTPVLAAWAAAAVVHAAAASAESYAEAAEAARVVGSAVLIETSTAYVREWAMAFRDRPVLLVLPKDGPHPILPARSALN